jgi:hypothetical protein
MRRRNGKDDARKRRTARPPAFRQPSPLTASAHGSDAVPVRLADAQRYIERLIIVWFTGERIA